MKTGIIFLVAILLFSLSNCKKYPEGGTVFRTKKKLVSHKWKLTLYEVNGVDSTDLINYNSSEDYKQITFYKEQTKYNANIYCKVKDQTESSVNLTSSNISFEVNDASKSQLSFYCVLGANNQNFCFKQIFTPEGGKTVWEIRRLTNKELIIRTFKTNDYVIKLGSQ